MTDSSKSCEAALRVLGRDGMLSVVMPAFNLGGVIARNIATVCGVLEGKIPFEVVAVDDGSSDDTASEIKRAAAESNGTVRFVGHAENSGKGLALRSGFKASRGSHVLLLDADLDLLPDRLFGFFEIMERDKADVVIGSKRHPDSETDYPFRRRVASSVYYSIVRVLFGLKVSDTQTGMKLFRRDVLKYSFERMLVKRFAFDIEVLAIARARGAKISEAPIKMVFGDKIGSLSASSVKSVLIDTFAVFYRLNVIRYYDHVELPSMPSPIPRVSVVIACPARSEYLDQAIAGIAKQTVPAHEVIVIPDEPFDKPQSYPECVKVLPSGKVRPAEKRNMGIGASTGDVVAFLDDDASPQPQWLEHALRHFSDETVGAVGGPAITPPGESHMAALGGAVYASPLVSANCRWRYVHERIRRVDDVPSCNLLVLKPVLDKIGGFNTRYWPGEDTILCIDVVKAGYSIIANPWAAVYHHRRALFAPHLRQVGRYAYHRGFFVRKFPETSLRLSYFVPTLFVFGVVFGAAACFIAPVLAIPYIAVLAVYLLAAIVFSYQASPLDWLIVFAGTVLTHFVYGVRFICGFAFGRMPDTVKAFDHPSEKGASK